jgi:superfamily II RNA helicase
LRYRDLELFPFQEQALQSIEQGHSVIVSAPTGAGKTLIAEFAIERALSLGKRILYTSPIKALSNQKYRDFRRRHGDLIGIMTGDVTINPGAPVQIMTTEIFRNTIFEDPGRLEGISHVVMDEVHFISDMDRGTVWEESIIFAPKQIRFVGLSATISNLDEFRRWIEYVRESRVDLVHTDERPVPLSHELFIPETGICRVGEYKRVLPRARSLARKRQHRRLDIIRHLTDENLLPALFFCFSRKECEARALRAMRRRFLQPSERDVILLDFDELAGQFEVTEDPATRNLREMAGCGILYHHAGMMPRHKELVERLFTGGDVRLLFTTETFALGVNMPARAVIFSSLRKFDGVGFSYLSTLSYYQMAGRAGRQGLDEEGTVYSLVDVERDDPKDVKNVIFGRMEKLESRFNLSYSAILNLYDRLGDDIWSAVDRSFAAFQHGGRSERDRALLEARLEILRSMGYIAGERVTGKGRFAYRLNAYEIQVTELYFDGVFEGLSAEDCALVIVALVFEARRGGGGGVTFTRLSNVEQRAAKLMRAFQRAETKRGIENTVKAADWSLSSAVRAWTSAADFREMEEHTTSRDGDLVRTFRMAVQVLRQFARAASDDELLAEKLWQAFELVNRDEVDAELELRIGD